MSNNSNDNHGRKGVDRRLTDIVREVKIAAAERSDVVVDMRDADRARLELLAEELQSVIDDVDPADDRFDFGISTGQQPRFWIDAVAHVHMGPDRRLYRVVRDTRLGRVILGEANDVREAADTVARYIAERVIERERMLSGDLDAMRQNGFALEAEEDRRKERPSRSAQPAAIASAPIEPAPVVPERKPGKGAGFVIGASWFILGCVAGAAALVAAFWDRITALLN
ncbi:hypothetical protein E2A64_17190 [Pseudohoeflea suaedae]|uniref:Uncharacterized protein n=1 Tax=Pseudohoeflea suaedae TaxID=877384 RepID=A0A4R5PHU0_9HYPH|nr:hypothetical protein [Pseudohoeflea suaedae]TDH34403.1 hypothetical protein E2A64_17190 [Pseudohoeflea suaedae]